MGKGIVGILNERHSRIMEWSQPVAGKPRKFYHVEYTCSAQVQILFS